MNSAKKLLFVFLITASLLSSGPVSLAKAQGLPDSRLVSANWLQANLETPGIRIIDMRADVRDYWSGHIPSAVYLDETALRWPQAGLPGKLIPVDVLGRLLEEMSIDQNTLIIIYTEINNYRATYLAWALDYVKHNKWAILAGGFNRWKSEGRPISRDFPDLKRIPYGRKLEANSEVRASLDQVKNRRPEGTVLLDVRPPEMYAGERGNWKRNGHIPGAVGLFWASFLTEDGNWKNLDLIQNNLKALCLTPDKNIILYCGQGLMSSHTYLTLKYILKFPKVAIFDGGFNEWTGHDDLPVETSKPKEVK